MVRGVCLGCYAMNPFEWLDRLHARSPIAAFLVALVISAACMLALAYLNADG